MQYIMNFTSFQTNSDSYLFTLQTQLATGNAKEHSYRPALQAYFESLNPAINAVNEPTRSEHGAPDFIFLDKKDKDLIYGYAETKDINVNLDVIEKSEQLKRYLGYPRLILTNYLEFRFFRNGEKYQTITIGELKYGAIHSLANQFAFLEQEILAFLSDKPETIKSAKKLAMIMGGKAFRIRENVKLLLTHGQTDKTEDLFRIYAVMKKLLVHDLSETTFADMYAQTLVYGLFIARYYDTTPEDFSRKEARDLVPASNPFLQEFFDHIIGPKFVKSLSHITDELCDVFSVSDIQSIIARHYNLFGESPEKDPIIHFYEDFLKEYDPDLKKSMGAYYTPVPIVDFIVKAVDDSLKSDFGITKGLASTDKTQRKVKIQATIKKENIHRVQILDPAVGTATFLNQIIKYIYSSFKNQAGMWPDYVKTELLPRLHGFELMMAPYTIAHLKLALTLKDTGFTAFNRRLGVYLTNTLEEGIKAQQDLFSMGLVEAITEEARSASDIKHDTPIMVVLGNPPYSGIGSNMTDYANSLINKYKVEPGGQVSLQERKHWLNDDYVKFVAFAEDLISKTGEGIMAMITNHGYLDNPTFRGMRWHLAKTFTKIYLLDLHGNTKKREASPDGSKDENVFDIQQGVSIMIAIKQKNTKKSFAEIYRSDMWGKRKLKFELLQKSTLQSLIWDKITLDKTSFSFTKNTNNKLKQEYELGIKIPDLFPLNSTGIVTMGDGFIISESKNEIYDRVYSFLNSSQTESELKTKYGLGKNYAKWIIENQNKNLEFDEAKIIPIDYRPFDKRFTYYDENLIWRRRNNVMQCLIQDNIGLITTRMQKNNPGAFVTNKLIAHKVFNSYDSNSIFPLYLYRDDGTKTANLHPNQLAKLTANLSCNPTPEDIFDYIYACLHSPSYRQEYKDFLKSDFPRVPIAKDNSYFEKLVKLGGKLRRLHLLDETELDKLTTTYPISGSNEIEMVKYVDGSVWINSDQYFGNVPENSWNFWIGGYQPAQKWLKDRKGKNLTFEQIEHYQKIITAQTKTIEIMKQIDGIT